MHRPCKNSLALPCHSAFPDEAPHVLSAPSLRCGWYSPVMGSRTAQQLNTLGVARISHQLSRKTLGVPMLLDLITIAYSPFEARPKMLSRGRLAFAVISVQFLGVFFTISL